MALQSNLYAAKTAVQPKLFTVFLPKKFPFSKLGLDIRLISFCVGKVGASLWSEAKVDHLDLLHNFLDLISIGNVVRKIKQSSLAGWHGMA